MKDRFAVFLKPVFVFFLGFCSCQLFAGTVLLNDVEQQVGAGFGYQIDGVNHDFAEREDFAEDHGGGDAELGVSYEPGGFPFESSSQLSSSFLTEGVTISGDATASAEWQERGDDIDEIHGGSGSSFSMTLVPVIDVAQISVSGRLDIEITGEPELHGEETFVYVRLTEMEDDGSPVLLWEVVLSGDDSERSVILNHLQGLLKGRSYRFEIIAESGTMANENHALEKSRSASYEVALVMPGMVYCRDRIAGDRDGDCKVDLGDFAVMAAGAEIDLAELAITAEGWLGCNLVPEDGCGSNYEPAAMEAAREGIAMVDDWLGQVSISGTLEPRKRFASILEEVSKFGLGGSENRIELGSGSWFWFELEEVDYRQIKLRVVGISGGLERTITVVYALGVKSGSVFESGVASVGPVELTGNVQLKGTSISSEADVYIEGGNGGKALYMTGGSQIDGDVFIGDPDGEVILEGDLAGIGGETGQAAIDDHVFLGVERRDFPEPVAEDFEQYATGRVIDFTSNIYVAGVYENVRIAAGTNPFFPANVTIKGIMYIESPNVVMFGGEVDVTGFIVGAGDWEDNSGANMIMFTNPVNLTSRPVSELPYESQFEGIRDMGGIFLMAPGFRASFGNSFDTLGGIIAANGIYFFGNAGGSIEGSVINYSDKLLSFSGDFELAINRSGISQVPFGFACDVILQREDESYIEH